ncbi:MAG TPA: ATP-binding cassette domain-containing protein, partial [Nocardioides sp.]|nr:ATP-binding cassette domain-containing protein [Nocardioides sp.]
MSTLSGFGPAPVATDTVLRLDAITYVAGRTLLDDVSVTFPAGKVTALSGPSGSGKTTLLSIAGGLLQATSGTAELDGRDMWTGSGDPLPQVAFVLQVYGLVPILSARENVSIALRARGAAPADAD